MIHLTNKAKEVVAYLRKNGFKSNPEDKDERPVYISAKMSDPEEDRDIITGTGTCDDCEPEMTTEHFDWWLRDYCYFEIDVDLYSLMPEENPYIDMDIVAADIRHNFWTSFYAYLRKEFGDDVEIRHNENRGDCEIERVSMTKTYRKTTEAT